MQPCKLTLRKVTWSQWSLRIRSQKEYSTSLTIRFVNPTNDERVRRVANAASIFKGQSLNTNLFSGPDLINNSVGILLRFREKPIAVMADIEAMFMQIAIMPEDHSCLRFLWPTDQTIRQYQYTRLKLGHVVHQQLQYLSYNAMLKTLPKTGNYWSCQQKSLYGWFRSFLPKQYRCSVVCLWSKVDSQKGGFNLTKFLTNEPNALELLKTEHIEKGTEDHRVLGLLWNSPSDLDFHEKLSKIDQDASQCTLRKLLSLIACLFDQLGIKAPIVIALKIILQDTWKEGLSSDDMPSWSKRKQIQDWIDKYLDSPQIQMPRSLSHLDISSGTNQLNVFYDES